MQPYQIASATSLRIVGEAIPYCAVLHHLCDVRLVLAAKTLLLNSQALARFGECPKNRFQAYICYFLGASDIALVMLSLEARVRRTGSKPTYENKLRHARSFTLLNN